jgi:O-antigen ligase
MSSHSQPPVIFARLGRFGWPVSDWPARIAALAVAALPISALYAPRALPGVLGIVVLAAVSAALGSRTGWPRINVRVVLALAGFVALGALSALWSVVPVVSIVTAAKLAGWALAAVVLFGLWPAAAGRDADLAGRALIGGLIVALILLAIDLSADLAVLKAIHKHGRAGATLYAFALNRGATVIALLLCPAVALCLARGWPIVAAVLGVAALAVLSASSSAAAILAALAGLAGFALAWWGGRATARVLIAAMALWLIAAPPVVGLGVSAAWAHRLVAKLEPSDVHRLLIWEFTIDRIAERPFLGWGLDGARRIPDGTDNLNDRVAGRFDGPDYDYLRRVFANNVFQAMPLHPHSATLQIWLELGAAGALLAAVLVWLGLDAAAQTPSRLSRASLVGTAAAAFVIANLSYGAWQSWWLAAVILAVALSIALVRAPATAPAPGASTA